MTLIKENRESQTLVIDNEVIEILLICIMVFLSLMIFVFLVCVIPDLYGRLKRRSMLAR